MRTKEVAISILQACLLEKNDMLGFDLPFRYSQLFVIINLQPLMNLPKSTITGITLLTIFGLLFSCTPKRSPVADAPLVVLTFDDAVKSHLTYVAPLLREYGFGATFFVTYAWMDDSVNFLTWKEIAALHELGFEIGNHSWTHANFSQPGPAYELEGELGLMEWMLERVGIPKPISYAHTGNAFGPEAIRTLERRGYRFARRGKQPEVAYGTLDPGPGYDPLQHHPLVIPTTLDFYPDMDLEHFTRALTQVPDHEIVVLQFHGVPDSVHPWVNTPPEQFRQYMDYLKDGGYQVIAMRDLVEYLPELLPEDPMINIRYPAAESSEPVWPSEVVASREQSGYWLGVMQRHGYTTREMAGVLGWSPDTIDRLLPSVRIPASHPDRIEVLPYPGGRHPRIEFQEGMLSPMRGTKLSVFLPWNPGDFVVLDVPEAVFTQFGLTFLGHKHIPTVFDYQQVGIVNRDWVQDSAGHWSNLWKLPNGTEIGARVMPGRERLRMELWLTNHTSDTVFSNLQTQVCVMLGQTSSFAALTNDNKRLTCPVVAVESDQGDQWIITGWQGCARPWGNKNCPCLHADPAFPDCAPGQTVTIRGMLWFYTGRDIDQEISRVQRELTWL